MTSTLWRQCSKRSPSAHTPSATSVSDLPVTPAVLTLINAVMVCMVPTNELTTDGAACSWGAERSARFRLGRMHERLSQLERKVVNVEARLSLLEVPTAAVTDSPSVGA